MENTITTQDWIDEATSGTVVNIGQLDKPTVNALNRLVMQGVLAKGRGGPFPAIKTVYAIAGFDFAADREAHVAEAMKWAELDEQVRRQQRMRDVIQRMLALDVARQNKAA